MPRGKPAPARAAGPARAGRHRRSRMPGWPGATLLGIVAALVVLLSSGIAIALTAAPPDPPAANPATTPATTPATPATPAATPTTGAGEPVAPTTPTRVPRPTEPEAPAPEAEPPEQEPPEAAPDPPPGGQVDEVTAQENEVVALTNHERAAAGCDEVERDERLRSAARGHSRDMADNDYFSHTAPDGSSFVERARDAGYPSPAGENIAMGYRTPADVVRAWMDSDGHRRNLLECSHQDIGVGLAYDRDGRPYWTQVFGRG